MITTVEKVLQRATPESQGIASAAILKFVETLESQDVFETATRRGGAGDLDSPMLDCSPLFGIKGSR